jgi:pimeloyl-ACP methyl ester carboxylesterase
MAASSAEDRLVIGDLAVEYRLIGPPPTRAPTIVMLHEGLGSVAAWGEFPERLSQCTGAGVFVYSRPGYGGSPSSDARLSVDYIRRHALELLPQILDAIAFRGGILLGHSDGASMAAAYAGTRDDDRVHGLALIAPHFCVEPETLAEIRRTREAFHRRDLRQRLARYHDDVDAAFRGWNDVWLDPAFADFNLREELARIRVPMLIIRGDNDRYGTHRQAWMAQERCRCPVEVVLLADCGHIPNREQPERTIAAIARLYDQVQRGQATG